MTSYYSGRPYYFQHHPYTNDTLSKSAIHGTSYQTDTYSRTNRGHAPQLGYRYHQYESQGYQSPQDDPERVSALYMDCIAHWRSIDRYSSGSSQYYPREFRKHTRESEDVEMYAHSRRCSRADYCSNGGREGGRGEGYRVGLEDCARYLHRERTRDRRARYTSEYDRRRHSGHGWQTYREEHRERPRHHSYRSERSSRHDGEKWSVRACDEANGHYKMVKGSRIGRNKEYEIDHLLGEGTFGKVVLCHTQDQQKVAVKIIRNIEKYRDAALIEIEILNKLLELDPKNDYHIIQLRDSFDHDHHMCLVFDRLGLSLFDFLKGNSFRPFPLSQIQMMSHQLLTAIAFMHKSRLSHTDLKPENILLENSEYVDIPLTDANGKAQTYRKLLRADIQLIDVGSATWEDQHHTRVVSTRHYRAPEVILDLSWSFPCDMWSIGCILFELYTGDALFQTHTNLEHLTMMERILGPIHPHMIDITRKQKYFDGHRLVRPEKTKGKDGENVLAHCRRLSEYNRCPSNETDVNLFDLIVHLLEYDPTRRITAAEALQHPFFKC